MYLILTIFPSICFLALALGLMKRVGVYPIIGVAKFVIFLGCLIFLVSAVHWYIAKYKGTILRECDYVAKLERKKLKSLKVLYFSCIWFLEMLVLLGSWLLATSV